MINSGLPETDALAAKLQELCDEPATFTNLDLVKSSDE
jgi:hypothetical protein